MITVQTWADIVGKRAPDAAFEIALARLLEARWLASVGQPSNRDADVVRVEAWGDLLPICTKPTRTLDAPIDHLVSVIVEDATLNKITVEAANRILDPIDLSNSMPDSLTLDENISVGDYVTEYLRCLAIEIFAGDVGPHRCTYFRDQLPWFLAGFVPCGWEGEWPTGRMRVF